MNRPRIVLLDADPAVRLSTVFALQAEEFEVQCHESAEALLADMALADNACLILDHRQPGVDGLDLLRQLRARSIALPAIVTVTNPSRDFCRQVSEAQGRLLEKPLLGDALVSAVRELTGGPVPKGLPNLSPDRPSRTRLANGAVQAA